MGVVHRSGNPQAEGGDEGFSKGSKEGVSAG